MMAEQDRVDKELSCGFTKLDPTLEYSVIHYYWVNKSLYDNMRKLSDETRNLDMRSTCDRQKLDELWAIAKRNYETLLVECQTLHTIIWEGFWRINDIMHDGFHSFEVHQKKDKLYLLIEFTVDDDKYEDGYAWGISRLPLDSVKLDYNPENDNDENNCMLNAIDVDYLCINGLKRANTKLDRIEDTIEKHIYGRDKYHYDCEDDFI